MSFCADQVSFVKTVAITATSSRTVWVTLRRFGEKILYTMTMTETSIFG